VSQEQISDRTYKGKILSGLEELSIKEIKEVADFINFLKSRKLLKRIDPEQAYFWTKEWQEGEREADEDIKAGRVSKAFDTAEEAVKALKNKELQRSLYFTKNRHSRYLEKPLT